MSSPSSHLVAPIALDFPSASAEQVAKALDRLFKAAGSPIHIDGKTVMLAAAATAPDKETAAPEGDRVKVLADPGRYRGEGQTIWVTTTSRDDPTLPAVLHRSTFQQPDFVLPLLQACESPAAAAELAAFEALVKPSMSGITGLRETLLALALSEVTDDIRSELPREPYLERLELSDRGNYVDTAFGLDPVEAMLTNPHALNDAAYEKNIDWMEGQKHDAITEAMKNWSQAEEDLTPVIELLGFEVHDVESSLESFFEENLYGSDVVKLELEGKVAVVARPLVQFDDVYVTFDGITSSPFNTVVDEGYLAMLDLLRIDIRAWIDHLANSAGLSVKPNWDFDLKAIIEEKLPLARFDPATGFHWENQALQQEMRETLITAIFGSAALGDGVVEAVAKAEHEIALQGYRAAIRDDAVSSTTIRLKAELEEKANALLTAKHGEPENAVISYLFDLAVQVVQSQAEELRVTWFAEKGIDLEKLAAISNSQQQFESFPALKSMPNYVGAVLNLSPGHKAYIEWKNPPHRSPAQPPLSSMKSLYSVLQNANYSGNFVIAFETDIQTLQELGTALQNETPKEVAVSNAYFHIHDYINGAGDGEPLDQPWIFTTEDIAAKGMTLRNDLSSRYNINSLYGQFLASASSAVVRNIKPPVAVEPRLVVEPEDSPAP